MTKEEFEALLKGFFGYAGSEKRPEVSWFLALERWADLNYNRTVIREPKPIEHEG